VTAFVRQANTQDAPATSASGALLAQTQTGHVQREERKEGLMQSMSRLRFSLTAVLVLLRGCGHAAAMNFHKFLRAFWRVFLFCKIDVWNGLLARKARRPTIPNFNMPENHFFRIG
jgi:hypothetical protein